MAGESGLGDTYEASEVADPWLGVTRRIHWHSTRHNKDNFPALTEYIYIYREREREREINIYIYIERERERYA